MAQPNEQGDDRRRDDGSAAAPAATEWRRRSHLRVRRPAWAGKPGAEAKKR